MFIDFLKRVFQENARSDAIVWLDKVYPYQWLLDRIHYWDDVLCRESINEGNVVILEADFSPNATALFLSLLDRGCILVPLTSVVAAKRREFIEIAQGEFLMTIGRDDEVAIRPLSGPARHILYENLRQAHHPGLVIFSSGSTGQSKAAVHDLSFLLEKFKAQRHKYRTITFLLYDHIGGLNTMLYTLANGGCLITVHDRSMDSVLKAVEQNKAELLPASPTFLNLMLLGEAYKKYDCSSLKRITYGTEPMPETTLKRLHELFPAVDLLQTYGLSEVGILRSKSKSSDSLWLKIGGDGFETKVVNGILHIKAKSAMLGYLNAESPMTADGWLDTGDMVEQEDGYLKILGRKSELINVGGQKVFPIEVENVIRQMDNVAEVTVYGEKNLIIGNIVCVRINLVEVEPNERGFVVRLKEFCRERLEPYKVPVKVNIVQDRLYSPRFKKQRTVGP